MRNKYIVIVLGGLPVKAPKGRFKNKGPNNKGVNNYYYLYNANAPTRYIYY